MRRSLCALILLSLAAVVAAGFARYARAEDAAAPRKVITRLTPFYPEFLKERNIGGVVRLSVVVTPSGSVKSVTPIGGNPILVDSAIESVKRWKYAPGENTDTLEVKIDFLPPNKK